MLRVGQAPHAFQDGRQIVQPPIRPLHPALWPQHRPQSTALVSRGALGGTCDGQVSAYQAIVPSRLPLISNAAPQIQPAQ